MSEPYEPYVPIFVTEEPVPQLELWKDSDQSPLTKRELALRAHAVDLRNKLDDMTYRAEKAERKSRLKSKELRRLNKLANVGQLRLEMDRLQAELDDVLGANDELDEENDSLVLLWQTGDGA